MDILLTRVTQQAVQYAIRSGITITTGYAIKQCGRLLKEAPKGKEREELMLLQLRLDNKIRIISPSIDMIELIAARGNTSLESAVSLTKDIRYDIQKLGTRVAHAANDEELYRRKSSRAKTREETDHELRLVISSIKLLLAKVEDAVPLINLAITTSGVNLSTKLSGSISPSRLLQASTFLTAGDSGFIADPNGRQQVGPTYTLSMFMMFAGHASRPVDEEGVRETTWKEVIHKTHVKLWRLPLDQLYTRPGETFCGHMENTIPADAKAAEFAYQMVIVEDLDDDRVHTFEENEAQPGPFDDVQTAGIRDVIPIHEISKIFYADTGKILNIGSDGETNNPVLLLKRDVHAEPPRRMMQRSQSRQSFSDELPANGTHAHDAQAELLAQFARESVPSTPTKEKADDSGSWRLPADLDPEWIAFEVYTEETDSESESEYQAEPERPPASRQGSVETGISKALQNLDLKSSPAGSTTSQSKYKSSQQTSALQISPSKRFGPPIKTSLSLLEMLLKLAALQQFRQESHLAIEDELLNFFLEDSATAGAGSDKDYRQRLRHDALKRVGFDPYDESPIKRRSEEYIQHARDRDSPRSANGYDETYAYRAPNGDLLQDPIPRLDFARQSVERSSPYSRGETPSPPSPYQRTPSRSATPDPLSEQHRSAVRAKYTSGDRPPVSPRAQTMAAVSPRVPTLATPPSSNIPRTRQGVLRAKSDVKGMRSPLGHVVTTDEE